MRAIDGLTRSRGADYPRQLAEMVPTSLRHTSAPSHSLDSSAAAHARAAKRRQKLIEQAIEIEETSAQDAGMLGYMARVLVQATMPHSPTSARQFSRTNGSLTVSITALGDHPLPCGSYPRLLLTWLSTEAAREKSRTIVLGESLSEFMRKLGVLPTGGKWGTIPRFRKATVSLFSSAVTCIDKRQPARDRGAIVHVADDWDLWWTPSEPAQAALWRSTVTLSERFFREITDRPIPIDLRAIRALKQSPMALDLYCWLTHRVSYLKRPTEIPWDLLRMQFGADYADTKQGRYEFRRKLLRALEQVTHVYRGMNAESAPRGLRLLPSRTHVRP